MSRLNLILLTILIILGGIFIFAQNKPEVSNTKNSTQSAPTSANIKPMLEQKTIRQPAVAGQFYPDDPTELTELINKFLNAAELPNTNGSPKILVLPHAGYVFSGQTAAYGFKTLTDQNYDTVIILGPSHNYPIEGLALYNGDAIKTPLGEIAINKKITDQLISASELIYADNQVHTP